jgi:hypothetical protein
VDRALLVCCGGPGGAVEREHPDLSGAVAAVAAVVAVAAVAAVPAEDAALAEVPPRSEEPELHGDGDAEGHDEHPEDAGVEA